MQHADFNGLDFIQIDPLVDLFAESSVKTTVIHDPQRVADAAGNVGDRKVEKVQSSLVVGVHGGTQLGDFENGRRNMQRSI